MASIKDIQVSLYDVFAAVADDWLNAFMSYHYYDCSDSMHTCDAAREMMESLSQALGHPTTLVNFIKAYKKTEYAKKVKEFLEEEGEEYDPTDFPTPLPIKLTQKDLDAV